MSLPPVAVGLPAQPADVGRQPAQRQGTHPPGDFRQVGRDRVIQAEPALVAQPEQDSRGQGLGDRSDPELGVPVGRRVLAGPGDVGQRAVPDHARDQRRGASGELGTGDDLVHPADGRQREYHRFSLRPAEPGRSWVALVDTACHDLGVLPVLWLIAGVLLAVAEMFTLDFVLIMLGAGAFAAAIVGLVSGNVLIEVIVFAIVSALGLAAVRPAIKRRLHQGAEKRTLGIEAFEGAEATVVEQVAEGRGMVNVGGELWQARPYDATQVIDAGAQVRIVEVKGATALVWRD